MLCDMKTAHDYWFKTASLSVLNLSVCSQNNYLFETSTNSIINEFAIKIYVCSIWNTYKNRI